jgi:RNAse (barnase) inhibitor barstar
MTIFKPYDGKRNQKRQHTGAKVQITGEAKKAALEARQARKVRIARGIKKLRDKISGDVHQTATEIDMPIDYVWRHFGQSRGDTANEREANGWNAYQRFRHAVMNASKSQSFRMIPLCSHSHIV